MPEAIWALVIFTQLFPLKESAAKGKLAAFSSPSPFILLVPRALSTSPTITGLSGQSRSDSRYYLCLHNHVPVFVSYFHAVTTPPPHRPPPPCRCERNELSSYSPFPLTLCVSSTGRTVTGLPGRSRCDSRYITRVYTIAPLRSRATATPCARRRGEKRPFPLSPFESNGITGLRGQSRDICVYTHFRDISVFICIFAPLPLHGPRPRWRILPPASRSSPPPRLAPDPLRRVEIYTPTCRCARVHTPCM